MEYNESYLTFDKNINEVIFYDIVHNEQLNYEFLKYFTFFKLSLHIVL